MKISLFIFLSSFVLLISCAIQPIATLDDFSASQNLLVIIGRDSVFPVSNSSFLNTSSVYGGQRDLELVVESGNPNQVFFNTVSDNQLSLSYPNSGPGYTVYQLDGIDDSMDINETGLNNFDATFGGSASAFQITGMSDVPIALNITVYTSTGIGKQHLIIPSSFTPTNFFLHYYSFSGSADFSSVGAIEIVFDGSYDVDALFSFFGIVGVADEAEELESSGVGDYQEVLVIDSFTSDSDAVTVVLPDPIPPWGVSKMSATLDESVLGGERKFYVFGNGYTPGLTFTGSVVNGSANLESPQGDGGMGCNYDGIGYTPEGLGRYNLTENGANAFLLSIKCDHDVYVAVGVRSPISEETIQKLFNATASYEPILFYFDEFQFKTSLENVVELDFNLSVRYAGESLIAYVNKFITVAAVQ